MPRIRRWFHVSHDINSDGEVWELTDRFGATGLRLWLEFLSIGDRNEGRLPELSEATVRQLSIKCNTTQIRVRQVCDWIVTKTWIVCDPSPRLRNWAIYNPLREDKKSHTPSPPTFPPIPSEPSSPKEIYAQPDGFAEFWNLYPKKKSRGQAEKAWKKLKPNGDLQATILRAVGRQRSSSDWLKQSGQFIPYPATWLNAKGWEDQGVTFSLNRRPVRAVTPAKVDEELTPEELERNRLQFHQMVNEIAVKKSI
jgi:hypothetical protein